MTFSWTNRDLDIAETLTRRVRLMTLTQIAKIWWPQSSSLRVVRRRLRRICEGGLINCSLINAHPLLRITKPLAIWSLGSTAPDFEGVANRAQTRWCSPARPTEAYYATKLSANLFGSSSQGLPDVHHRDHDLLLSQVFVTYRTTRTAESEHWLGEDSRSKAGFRIKDPDAFLVGEDGQDYRVIESAGKYSAEQCRSFHEHCCKRQLAYELW